jgi:hypothetical protein
VSTEVAASCSCTHEPPHRFVITQRSRLRDGVLLTLQRVDEPYPPREIFVTGREIKMPQDDAYKACFVCVDRGFKETAIVISKADIELGLPPA